jgi:hypothetical protein
MTKTLSEKIAVMQAAELGEKIEVKHFSDVLWKSAPKAIFNWQDYDYRVEPCTIDVVVCSWDGTRPFVLSVGDYNSHSTRNHMIVHSRQTITY